MPLVCSILLTAYSLHREAITELLGDFRAFRLRVVLRECKRQEAERLRRSEFVLSGLALLGRVDL